ncbi:thymic stromal cotransporter homolog [Colossoma macropomum]|uniref:thymic stromal cotransporter homolog n=1 Tax=Colossoma macropomum TaxID=42526 RepID=UPI0018653AF3|nr:thymic stromal cotransporter homolog [Colossoma macropomum]XP_036451022.1 thymic stromal cotransporter homolog [Colossoma macropomum]
MAVLRSARKHVEPVVFCAQMASSFFDTGLQMVVKQRSENVTRPSDPHEDQNAIANFYMTFNMLTKFIPILPALILAQIGDRGYRKVPIVVPLVGYSLSRALLLLEIWLEWRVEVMYAAPVIHGLCGGFSSYWAGVMALVSVSTSEEERSLRIMRTELVYGIAGFLGSLASGHLFKLYTVGMKQGVLLASMSVALYVFCLLYATCVLQVSRITLEQRDSNSIGIITHSGQDRTIIALLFVSGILYDVAVAGGVEILSVYVLKAPLEWSATEVGYGNAAGSLIFITSFLGMKFFTRFAVTDASMIMIGMVSFMIGIYCMTFVTTTAMYFLARSIMLFALIPMPTIRSLLSKQVRGTSYGMTFICLQLSFRLASLATTPIYTKIYESTLDTFPGFVFTLSSIITFVSIIPISVVGCHTAKHENYERIQGN